MNDYIKKYIKYKNKYIQLKKIGGCEYKKYSTPSLKFQKLRDYFISIRNKKIIEDITKLREKYQIL